MQEKHQNFAGEKSSESFSISNGVEPHNQFLEKADLKLKTLEDVPVDQFPKKILEKVSLEYLLSFRLLPLHWDGKKLQLAVANPYPFYPIDNLSQRLDSSVEIVLMDSKKIERILRMMMESDLEAPVGLLEDARKNITDYGTISIGEDLIRQESEAPIVRMVNSILLEAIREKITDIHFHPKLTDLAVMYRRDGLLHEVHTIPQALKDGIISRLKVMSKLDVTQRQQPQDGRLSLKSAEKEIEVRVSVVPTVQGERIVLRLLDRENLLMKANELGMEFKDYQVLRSLMDRPNGMILVTGPTGSGKTTTLYSFISELNLSQRNVMTIEDPVEYKIEGITQMQVRPSLGLGFAQGLRSILRQDPDIILVGEIRDQETAQIAIRAALTGHLVLATLHTTDAPGAITRLLDIGIEPYLISSALVAVVSQRLIRKICEKCHPPSQEMPSLPKQKHERVLRRMSPSETADEPVEALAKAGHNNGTLGKPRGLHREGCSFCFSTGFRGRTGIFEFLVMDDDLRKLIYQQSDLQAFRHLLNQKGILNLEVIGREKVRLGITTEEEILRVTGTC